MLIPCRFDVIYIVLRFSRFGGERDDTGHSAHWFYKGRILAKSNSPPPAHIHSTSWRHAEREGEFVAVKRRS